LLSDAAASTAFCLTQLAAIFYLAPQFFIWRRNFLSGAAPSKTFYLTQLQAYFCVSSLVASFFFANAAPSIAFYHTQLQA